MRERPEKKGRREEKNTGLAGDGLVVEVASGDVLRRLAQGGAGPDPTWMEAREDGARCCTGLLDPEPLRDELGRRGPFDLDLMLQIDGGELQQVSWLWCGGSGGARAAACG